MTARNDLVARLREQAGADPMRVWTTKKLIADAADRIEALEAEVAALVEDMGRLRERETYYVNREFASRWRTAMTDDLPARLEKGADNLAAFTENPVDHAVLAMQEGAERIRAQDKRIEALEAVLKSARVDLERFAKRSWSDVRDNADWRGGYDTAIEWIRDDASAALARLNRLLGDRT